MVRCTWSASFLRCSVAQQPLPTKFGIKVVTATYYSSDCKNSMYYRTSRDQPYKLLYHLMSSALFRKIWCIYLHPVRSYWHFFYFTWPKNPRWRQPASCIFRLRIWPFRRVDRVAFVFCTKFGSNIRYSHWDRRTYAWDVHLMTSRELTSGFDFSLRGHFCMAVMHLHIKIGADIFI